MGVYDCYGRCQLKVGPCELKVYDVGDKVPISDGIYLDYGGAVVIKDGVFVAEFEDLTDKYGSPIDISDMVDERNPVNQAVKIMMGDGERRADPDDNQD